MLLPMLTLLYSTGLLSFTTTTHQIHYLLIVTQEMVLGLTINMQGSVIPCMVTQATLAESSIQMYQNALLKKIIVLQVIGQVQVKQNWQMGQMGQIIVTHTVYNLVPVIYCCSQHTLNIQCIRLVQMLNVLVWHLIYII